MISPLIVFSIIGAFVSFVFMLDLELLLHKAIAFVVFSAFVAILIMSKPSPAEYAHVTKTG